MSTGSTQPFRSIGTVILTASATPAAVQLAGTAEAALIYNAGTSVAMVMFGGGPSDAVTGGTPMPVPPGGSRLIHVGRVAAYASASTSGGSGQVYVTSGEGTVY